MPFAHAVPIFYGFVFLTTNLSPPTARTAMPQWLAATTATAQRFVITYARLPATNRSGRELWPSWDVDFVEYRCRRKSRPQLEADFVARGAHCVDEKGKGYGQIDMV